MSTGSLTVVGSGIKFLTQFTPEMQLYVQKSDKVLYLVNEAGAKEWIINQNPNSESLDELYHAPGLRVENYRKITHYILETVRKPQHVCVVIYGNPILFAEPGLNAVIQAQKEEIDARALPSISAADCLFADLLVDTHYGYQSYEATDFLIHKRPVSTASHLILWEVGFIGQLHYPLKADNRLGALVLFDYLSQFYPLAHEVVLYEAAQYPGLKPTIQRMRLEELPYADYSPITTLYVAPATLAKIDETITHKLKISLEDLYR